MAIDSAEKRRSVAGVPFFIFLGVTPNVAKDLEWRQQAAWGYSGIAVGEGVPGGAVAHTMKIRHWHRSWVALVLAISKWVF